MKVLNNLDLNKNQLLNVALQNLASAPASPVEGQVYFNTSDSLVYVYDGTSWYSVATINDVGLRLYTEENYITDGEPLALSVNNLDMAIGSLYQNIDGGTPTSVYTVEQNINGGGV